MKGYRILKVPFLFFVLSLVVHISGGLRLQTAAHNAYDIISMMENIYRQNT